MGSWQQVIVGGVLLVTAFFFGRYVTNQPGILNAVAESPDEQAKPLKLQSDSIDTESPGESNAVQRSLRDRILGARGRGQADIPEAHDRSNNLATGSVLPEIVVPDFSFLESQIARNAQMPPERDANFPAVNPESIEFNRQKTDADQNRNDRQQAAQSTAVVQPEKRLARFSITPQQAAAEPTQRRIAVSANTSAPSRDRVSVDRSQKHLTLAASEYVDYTTVFGDTLHSLSNRFFGTTDYYLDIYLANRSLLPNPSEVPVNTTIRIPISGTFSGTGLIDRSEATAASGRCAAKTVPPGDD